MNWMKGKTMRSAAVLLFVLFSAVAGRAQSARLEISHLDKLADKASETVEVTLDEKLLQMAARFLSDKNPTEAKVKELVAGLKGVYVRVFEFDKPGEYGAGDIESVRTQLSAPGWQRIVGVRSRRDGNNVDVHLRYQGDAILGLAILSIEPRELTFVNIVGAIDLEKLRQLEGQFGIPQLDLEKAGKGKK